jgi:hypothetical protein
VSQTVKEIDRVRRASNRSSAIRQFVLDRVRSQKVGATAGKRQPDKRRQLWGIGYSTEVQSPAITTITTITTIAATHPLKAGKEMSERENPGERRKFQARLVRHADVNKTYSQRP